MQLYLVFNGLLKLTLHYIANIRYIMFTPQIPGPDKDPVASSCRTVITVYSRI